MPVNRRLFVHRRAYLAAKLETNYHPFEGEAKCALGIPMPERTGSLLEYGDVYHLDPFNGPR